MNDESKLPLEHDHDREATDSIRGYRYQILCTVEEWINLDEGEKLYLEGAEDFDRLTEAEAISTQVKDTPSQKITLRSKDVVAAINNYWTLQERNASKSIQFRFLTTSEITTEQGNPLGMSGVSLWNSIRSQSAQSIEAELGALRDFLLTLPLNDALKEFLKNSNLEDVHKELVCPIEWLANASDAVEVQQSIQNRLVEHGSKSDVSPDLCDKVLYSLCHKAWEVATRKSGRFLSKAEWLRIFERETTVRVGVELLGTLLSNVSESVGKPDHRHATFTKDSLLSGSPPLPQTYYSRLSMKGELQRALDDCGICLVYGRTGVGKTSLIADLFEQENCRWIDFRGYAPEQIATILKNLESHLRNEENCFNVVIEDLNITGDFRCIEAPLSRLVQLLRERECKLVITSERDIPSRFSQLLSCAVISVEPFSVAEIGEFLRFRGCSSKALVDIWAPLLLGLTSGHPQLLQARVEHLISNGFPEPEPDLLLNAPEGVENVHKEARSLIASLDEPARLLLYRLSLALKPLDRQRIIQIASIEPSIDSPGNVLDALTPWIERVGNEQFRVSPLAKGAGRQVKGEKWAKSAHAQIAISLLEIKTLSQDDVAELFFHALVGGGASQIVWIVLGRNLLLLEDEVLAAIYQSFPLIVNFGLRDEQVLEIHPEVRFMFRLIQYRVAVAGGSPYQSEIAQKFNEEHPWKEGDTTENIPRIIWLILRFQFGSSPSVAEAFELACELLVNLDSVVALILPEVDTGERDEWNQMLLQLPYFHVVQRVSSASDLKELVQLLMTNEDRAKELLNCGNSNSALAEAIRAKSFWRASGIENEESQELLAAFRDLKRISDRWGFVEISRVCARTIVEIISDQLKRPEEAFKIAEDFSEEIKACPLFTMLRAGLFALFGNDRMAVDLLLPVLDQREPDGEYDVEYAFAFRSCACALSRQGNFELAAQYFEKAAPFYTLESMQVGKVGLIFDAGYNYWLVGESDRAISQFRLGVTEVLALRTNVPAMDLVSIERRANYLLAWILADEAERTERGWEQPSEGFCSNLEPISEKDAVALPPEFILLHLMKIEHEKSGDSESYGMFIDEVSKSEHFSVLSVLSDFEIKRAISRKDCAELVKASLKYAGIMTSRTSQMESEGISVSKESLDSYVLVYLMVTTLIYFREIESIDEALLSLIRTLSNSTTFFDVANEYCDIIRELSLEGKTSPQAIISNPEESGIRRTVAALLLTIECKTTPEYLLVAQMTLLQTIGALPQRESLACEVVDIFEKAWSQMLERPHLFPSPKLAIPGIRAVIGTDKSPFARIKMLLLAADSHLPGANLGPGKQILDSLPDE